jgi:hypothetical protein
MIIDAIVVRALYVDASLSYLMIILLNYFMHPKTATLEPGLTRATFITAPGGYPGV